MGQASYGLTKRLLTKQGLIALLLFAGSLTVSLLIVFHKVNVKELVALGYIGAFFLPLIGDALPTVPLPWLLIVAALGAAYSLWLVVLLAVVGATIGHGIAYWMGRSLTIETWRFPQSARLTRFLGSLRPWQRTVAVAVLSLSPIMSCPGLVAGVLRYPPLPTFSIIIPSEAVKIWLAATGVYIALHWRQ